MKIDASVVVSLIAVIVAALSWLESRRMSKLTTIALERQSYEKAETLPSVEALKVVEVGGKNRAQLIVFNQRDVPFRVNCVKCYRYDPKSRNLKNWMLSIGVAELFDWNYSREKAFWNPKGSFDDSERYAEETLPFTLVKDKEILLVTLTDYQMFSWQQYKFEVITTQGTAIWEGVLPNGKSSLPHEHHRTIA